MPSTKTLRIFTLSSFPASSVLASFRKMQGIGQTACQSSLMASFTSCLNLTSQIFGTIFYASVQNSCMEYTYFVEPDHILLVGLCVSEWQSSPRLRLSIMERPAVCHALLGAYIVESERKTGHLWETLNLVSSSASSWTEVLASL